MQKVDNYHLNKHNDINLDHITPKCGRNLNQLSKHLVEMQINVIEFIESQLKKKLDSKTIILDKLEEIIKKSGIVSPPIDLSSLMLSIGVS